MDAQATVAQEPTVNPPNIQTDDTAPSSEKSLTVAVLSLRFPRPQGSKLVADWVSNSSPDIRQPFNMSETGSLADSAYEVIHGTDTESQDDRLTESTCSLSGSRPEDVHSLDGSTDHYNTDSEEEEEEEEGDQSSHASSIRYTDQALQNPSTQLPSSNLENGPSTEGVGSVVRSIQLQESDIDDPVLVESISAKHAIREFSEGESADIAKNLALANAPKHLVASIRQTMSQSYLSIQEPLRILYVGRPDAQRAIVLKICSAIWASPDSKQQDYFHRYREGVYNIVPISSFGPEPELDLMEASQYQIKVEHCTSAEEINYRGAPTPGDTAYSIIIENEKVFLSLSTTDGVVVEPRWKLPHLAIFYSTADDGEEADETRHAAWSFLDRHGVPSIFVAEQQEFRDPSWGKYIDEHSVHLCLESRDRENPMVSQRFPIDFASFADIDARQMNRNLAYLTGLAETEETARRSATQIGVLLDPKLKVRASSRGERRLSRRSSDSMELARWLWSVFPMLLLLAGPFLVLSLVDWLRPGGLSHFYPSSSSLGVCVPSQTFASFTTTQSPSVTTSTKTVVINITSTKTVQASQTQLSTSTSASALSFAGFLSDKSSAVPADIEAKEKKFSHSDGTACSVRIHSPTEILVAIPSRSKTVWLAQGAIDIAVRRNDNFIKTKISSVDEGVLVELEPKDANGVLNVTVVTSRRPKINETFQVDFGKSVVGEVAEIFEAGLRILQDALKNAPWTDDSREFLQRAQKLGQEFTLAFDEASETARSRTLDVVKQAAQNARERLIRHRNAAETIRKEVDLSVLRAQVTSRLWWLKMQGKLEEYADYQRNASKLLQSRHQELFNGQGGRMASPKDTKSRLCSRTGIYTPWRKGCGRRDDVDTAAPPRKGTGENIWRTFMGGM